MLEKTVLISGVGIAGPTLAFWLQRAGFQPTLVECAPRPRAGGFVIDFWGLGYDVAERMGLSAELHCLGYHMRELRIVDRCGRRVAGLGARAFEELTGGRFITLARSDLSRLLFEKIERTAEVIFDDEVVGIEQQADCVTVEFKRTSPRRFGFVVGADGLHSRIRALSYGPQQHFEKRLGYLAAAFEVRGYRPRDEDVYVMLGCPGRMLGRIALHEDRTLFLFVFAAGPALLSATLDTAQKKSILREHFEREGWECAGILDELDAQDEFYFDRVSQIRLGSWSRGRVALVGDAAFCVSLTAGQGSALAMAAAYILAGEIARVPWQPQLAFLKYEERLRRLITSKQRAAERFAAAFAPKTRLGLTLRNFVVNLAGLPGMAKLALGPGVVDSIALPQYPAFQHVSLTRPH